MENKKEINEYILKLTGKASLPGPLEMGKNYKVHIDGSVTSITESDNEDSTKDVYYKFSPVFVEAVDEKGVSLKSKDLRSYSQKQRALIRYKWQQTASSKEFEDVYASTMNRIMAHIDEFIEL